jgi:NAD(P)-dependent dehydrogenase (short-subunit alcohol dehydrogenase family)
MKRRDFISLSSMVVGSTFLPFDKSEASTRINPLSGHVALITGGTSGIGENAVRELAKEGALVAFCGRRESLGREIERDIRKQGRVAFFIKADVSNEKEVNYFVGESLKKYKKIDSIFINAGVAQKPAPFHLTSPEELQRLFSINCFGAFYCARAVLPHMMKQKSGHIIFNTSYGVNKCIRDEAVYSASKIAVNSFVRHLAIDYAQYNIKTASIEPLAVKTPMLEKRAKYLNKSLDEIGNKLLKRAIQPIEVSDFIKSLLILDSQILSGSTFDLSAGVSNVHAWPVMK